MRITFINQFYRPDSAPTAQLTADVAEFFAKQGHDVTVVASQGGYVGQAREADNKDNNQPHVCRIWTPQFGKGSVLKRCIDYSIFYVLTLIKMLAHRRQDVVIALTTPPYIAWAGAAHKLLHRRCRLILWNMDCYPEVAERAGVMKPHGPLARAMYWLNHRLFNRLDHLVCLDQAMVDLLAPYSDARRERGSALPTTVIPNWEKLASYPPDSSPNKWEGIIELGLDGRFLVLYMGNMGFGHDFESVLDAAEQLRDEPIAFLFIGGGKRYQEIAEQAKQRNLDHVVTIPYLPWEQVPQAMLAGGCALITLRDDMLGVMSPSKLHANLAAGLPILYVGPTGSNVDHAITRFGCGLSARHGEVESIVSYIRLLANDPSHREALRTKSREAFDQAYNDTVTLPQFLSLLDQDR